MNARRGPDRKTTGFMVRVLVVTLLAAGFVRLAAAGSAAAEVSETRALGNFDRIALGGAFDVDVRAGAPRTRVMISGDAYDVARVTTDVRDGTLFVGTRWGSSMQKSPKITIELPVLRAFENAGAADAKIVGLTGGDLKLRNSGVGSIVARGRAAREQISVSGVGSVDATGVDAGDVTVENAGAGSVRVRAHGALTMSVAGVGSIRYTGHPTSVTSSIAGVGSISRL